MGQDAEIVPAPEDNFTEIRTSLQVEAPSVWRTTEGLAGLLGMAK